MQSCRAGGGEAPRSECPARTYVTPAPAASGRPPHRASRAAGPGPLDYARSERRRDTRPTRRLAHAPAARPRAPPRPRDPHRLPRLQDTRGPVAAVRTAAARPSDPGGRRARRGPQDTHGPRGPHPAPASGPCPWYERRAPPKHPAGAVRPCRRLVRLGDPSSPRGSNSHAARPAASSQERAPRFTVGPLRAKATSAGQSQTAAATSLQLLQGCRYPM